MIAEAEPRLYRVTQGCHRAAWSETWAEFADENWRDSIMDWDVTDRLFVKQGRSIARLTLTTGCQSLVVFLKRHYELPRWRGWLASLFPSRAWAPSMEEFQHLQWAEAAGIAVPRVHAVGQIVTANRRLQGYLAVEELSEMMPLHQAIPLAHAELNRDGFTLWKERLIAEMVRLTGLLHDRKQFHQDLYLCHYYVSERFCRCVPESWMNHIVMIDFHRLRRQRFGATWFQLKDLAQLLYSTFDVDGIDDVDRANFWKRYRKSIRLGRHWPTSWLLRWIRWKAERYARHNARRPAIGQGS